MMKKKYFLNANIIDPHNNISEIGGLIIGEDGKIEGVGKKVNKNNIPSREKVIDLKENYIFPGIVDMRVFVGEPGYEYKENFRTLSNAALSGGVTDMGSENSITIFRNGETIRIPVRSYAQPGDKISVPANMKFRYLGDISILQTTTAIISLYLAFVAATN